MKLKEVIEQVDAIKPNSYSNDQKTSWISNLEGRVQTEVFLLDEVIRYSYTEDSEKTLLIDPPYDDIYGIYLQAMIDYAQGEYRAYHNTMAMFNSMWSEFAAWFFNRYDPVNAKTVELGTVDYTVEEANLYTLPPYSILTRLDCRVETEFDSGDALTLSIGEEALMGPDDMDITKSGLYTKTVLYRNGASETDIAASLESGEESEGAAVVYGRILRPWRGL